MADGPVNTCSAASALTGTELLYADDGVADVKVTATQVKTFVLTTPIITTQVTVNLNAASAPTPATGTGVQLVGTDATVARIESDAFGAIAAFTARRANGTGASPTALASGDQIGAFNFHGYYVTGGPGYSGVQANVAGYATQNWTSTNQGTKVVIRTTPNNSTTLTDALTLGQDQSVAMASTATIATSLAIGGATIGSNALAVTGTALFNGVALFPAGASGAPSVAIGDAATGFYKPSSGTIGIHGGTLRLTANSLLFGGASPLLWYTGGAFAAVNLTVGPTGASVPVLGLWGVDTNSGAGLLFREMTAPTAPATNNVILFAEDNGAGKTRVVLRFPTGADVVLGTEA